MPDSAIYWKLYLKMIEIGKDDVRMSCANLLTLLQLCTLALSPGEF